MKKSNRGFTDVDFVIALLVMQLVGGHALDDLQALRDDSELVAMVGLRMPAPTTAGDYLRNVTSVAGASSSRLVGYRRAAAVD